MNISYSLTLRSMDLSWTLNWCLTHAYHIIWKILVHWVIDLSSVDTFHYTISKNHFHKYHNWSHWRNLLSIGRLLSSECQITSFPKLNLSWKLEFHYFIFLEVIGLFCSFSRKCLSHTQMWVTIVCQSLFQVKTVLCEPRGRWGSPLWQIRIRFSRRPCRTWGAAQALCAAFPSHPGVLERLWVEI